VDKRYISPGDLLRDAYELGWRVFDSGYRPDYLIGIWRGGTPIAIAIHELLHILGVNPDHLAIRTVSYTAIGRREQQVRVDGLEYLAGRLQAGDRLLLVDDVHDTGLTLQQVIEDKPGNNRTGRVPDYYLHRCDEWLVFPHELSGLTPAELEKHKRNWLSCWIGSPHTWISADCYFSHN
jgi:hypoxanthine phosphoribosyltransferase